MYIHSYSCVQSKRALPQLLKTTGKYCGTATLTHCSHLQPDIKRKSRAHRAKEIDRKDLWGATALQLSSQHITWGNMNLVLGTLLTHITSELFGKTQKTFWDRRQDLRFLLPALCSASSSLHHSLTTLLSSCNKVPLPGYLSFSSVPITQLCKTSC